MKNKWISNRKLKIRRNFITKLVYHLIDAECVDEYHSPSLPFSSFRILGNGDDNGKMVTIYSEAISIFSFRNYTDIIEQHAFKIGEITPEKAASIVLGLKT